MNVALTQAAEGLPRRAFTVDDIRRMIDAGVISEDERFELVEGDLVMMSAKGIVHERIKSALLVAIARALPGELDLGVEASLRLTDTVMLEPDLAVFPRHVLQAGTSGFARLDPGDAQLVIEIAASSLAYDKGAKALLYARHRVREFWVIDANERITWIYSGPSGDKWSSIVERSADELLTTAALPKFAIRLADI